MKTVYATVIRGEPIKSSPHISPGDLVTVDIDGEKHVSVVSQDAYQGCVGCLLYGRSPAVACPVKVNGLLVCCSPYVIFKPVETIMEDI